MSTVCSIKRRNSSGASDSISAAHYPSLYPSPDLRVEGMTCFLSLSIYPSTPHPLCVRATRLQKTLSTPSSRLHKQALSAAFAIKSLRKSHKAPDFPQYIRVDYVYPRSRPQPTVPSHGQGEAPPRGANSNGPSPGPLYGEHVVHDIRAWQYLESECDAPLWRAVENQGVDMISYENNAQLVFHGVLCNTV